MSTVIETAYDDARWVSLCEAQSDLPLFVSPAWSAVIAETYGFSMRALLCIDDGLVSAGMPFAFIDDFRGPRCVALAFADNLEPIPMSSWHIFEDFIASQSAPWTVRTRCEPARAHSYREAARHHTITVPATFDEAEQNFHYKHRQNIKQAEKAGLQALILDGEHGIDTFYALHSQVRKQKHGLVPQPRTFFDNIAKHFFPEHGFVLAAFHEERPVSVMFFVISGNTLYYKFSASALDSLGMRPNHFLITRAIEIAVERQFKNIDLGISDTDGLIRFKERVGGKAQPVFAAAYNVREKTAAVAEVEAAFGKITALLTQPESPLAAAQRGGEILYRFFT